MEIQKNEYSRRYINYGKKRRIFWPNATVHVARIGIRFGFIHEK
jgi:hypothetical protein